MDGVHQTLTALPVHPVGKNVSWSMQAESMQDSNLVDNTY